MKSFRSVLLAVGFLALVSCGGDIETDSDSTPKEKQGQFVDSPVEGLHYSTSPGGLSGITDSEGRYDYVEGDEVTFSIGNIILGSAAAEGVVTPQDLVPLAGIGDSAVVNRARLLMTLDADGDPEPNIKIPSEVSAAASQLQGDAAEIDFVSIGFDDAARELIDNLTAGLVGEGNVYETGLQLVPAQEAEAHLRDSLRDSDGDGEINGIDTDDDNDGMNDAFDNCPSIDNIDQVDTDGDLIGNACDGDDDGDGVADESDNCQLLANVDQVDTDGDAQGNACDIDDDNDGIPDHRDPFPLDSGNTDTDGDGTSDGFDDDDDNDGFDDGADNCPLHVNADQLDTDSDGQGDACDADDDNDGIPDEEDDNPLVADSVTLTILRTQNGNGTITPSETQIVNQGKQLEFTVIANAGYYPNIWGCGGSLVSTTYTTAALDADCTIMLMFKPPTAPLNDTGIFRCTDTDDYDLACPQAGLPRQDAEFGRDAIHNDDSDGNAGFSFTKICNSGEAAGEGNCPANPSLGSGANNWACNRDNVTGLMWEVKTDDGGLRDRDNTYTWYNSNSNANGGDAGTENGGTCSDNGNCDSEKYFVSVNAAGLCGYNDWSIPDINQLLSIVELGATSPRIDTVYFPNSFVSWYWSASSNAKDIDQARVINFFSGNDNNYGKGAKGYLRLVRTDNN